MMALMGLAVQPPVIAAAAEDPYLTLRASCEDTHTSGINGTWLSVVAVLC